mgnify:FL=1
MTSYYGDRQTMKEQSAITAQNKALRNTAIRKMLDEGLTAVVICSRVGLSNPQRNRSITELKKMSGWMGKLYKNTGT